jgi:beta-glucosidase
MCIYRTTTNITIGVNHSARKLLREKFPLGLFDSPFVDPEAAERVVGNAYFRRIGEQTQRRAYTLLKNKNDILPLKPFAPGARFYIEGFNSTFLARRGFTVVPSPEEADYALLRLQSPTARRPGTGGFSSRYDWGPFEFSATEQARQKAIYDTVPTIVNVNFNRPATIPEIAERASALFGSYGSSTDAFLDVVFGVAEPEGKLPFDLPRSTAAVEDNVEDVPFDTKDPVFKFRHGLRYGSKCGNEQGRVEC